jgi:single-strand selective monofunctional uracil DNA glycosylase
MVHSADSLLAASDKLCKAVEKIDFTDERIAAVYNPLVYARTPFKAYIRRFGMGRKKTLFLGMNPGPWGMAQTGVPFGEIDAVSRWMGIREPVEKPDTEHPKRPVEGFHCSRSEVSGRRLWALMEGRFTTAENFFADHLVINYCPLVFMEESGKNLTPDKLPKEQRLQLQEACDAHLAELIAITGAENLIGIGAYAEKAFLRVSKNLSGTAEREYLISSILHPSPASPAANRGWPDAAESKLVELGVWQAV